MITRVMVIVLSVMFTVPNAYAQRGGDTLTRYLSVR